MTELKNCPRDGQTREWHLAVGGTNAQGEDRTNGEFMGCWFGVSDAAWEARQQAIRECTEDLRKALDATPGQSWSTLVEMAGLYREISRQR